MKKSSGYKPYVYKRAEELGIPVVEGRKLLNVVVTMSDVQGSKKANSKHCALTRAALRIPGVVAAYVFRSMAYLEYRDRMVRFQLPVSVQKEIVSFDRSKIFAEGAYHLRPPSPSSRRRQHRLRSKKETERKRAQRALDQQRKTRAQVALGRRVSQHVGDRTVAGIRGHEAPHPLSMRTPSKYVHRTQYVRDLHEPQD